MKSSKKLSSGAFADVYLVTFCESEQLAQEVIVGQGHDEPPSDILSFNVLSNVDNHDIACANLCNTSGKKLFEVHCCR